MTDDQIHNNGQPSENETTPHESTIVVWLMVCGSPFVWFPLLCWRFQPEPLDESQENMIEGLEIIADFGDNVLVPAFFVPLSLAVLVLLVSPLGLYKKASLLPVTVLLVAGSLVLGCFLLSALSTFLTLAIG